MKLEAILEEFAFLEIIHTAVNYQKTGMFSYEAADGEKAEIYMADGDIVHAQLGQAEGEDVLVDLFFREEGKITFHAGEKTARKSVYTDSLELIIMYAERVDDVRKIQKELPDLSTVLVRSPRPERGMTQIDITLDQWQVLSLANGRRTIDEIIKDSGKNDAVIKEMLVYLIEHGLLVDPRESERYLSARLDFLNQLYQACNVPSVHGALWEELIQKKLVDMADENMAIKYVKLEDGTLQIESKSLMVCNRSDIDQFETGIRDAFVAQGNLEYGHALMRYKLTQLGR